MYTIMCILQVRPSDLDRYKLPAQCRLQLTEHDRKMGEELLQEAFVSFGLGTALPAASHPTSL